MSVLESIRKRTGLLVGIIGLALVIFILQGARGTDYGGSMFGGGPGKVENSAGTINGRNEADDGIREIGGYVHSITRLSSKLDVVGAIRLDKNSRLESAVLSPRVALVFSVVHLSPSDRGVAREFVMASVHQRVRVVAVHADLRRGRSGVPAIRASLVTTINVPSLVGVDSGSMG